MKRNTLIAFIMIGILFAMSCTRNITTNSDETQSIPVMIQLEGVSVDETSDLSPVILVR